IIISAEGKIHLQRFREIIENAIELAEMKDDDENQFNGIEFYIEQYLKNIIWLEKDFFEGFILEQNKIACFTEHQIFSRKQVLIRSKKYKQKQSISLKEVKQLNIGDYLVHEEKGICKFNGFQTIQVAGKLQDCIKLIFADDGTLYVNLNYLHLIQKYNAADGVVPKLSRLGTNEWKRKKAKTKQRLRELAFDLIKLYAKRKEVKGTAYPVDNIWQKELEASFIYEDTLDQAETTDAVKKDMESETPMDRLVCGDVGFGKTEIAIRAAFKAVQAGKQVAVLVPTTILAEQHYITFSDRMKQYPIIIDSLSRFKQKKEQQDILKKLKEGKLDILIGTHRILSKDIAFKDLGLLIIDEEHRFGVGAKESLRAMKANVDTLTLTATPIPRTLNFSLLGARDLSVIETPPRNRIPTVTEIIEWNNKTIIEATKQEIERSGQVFFVTDRVNDIDRIAMDLQQLLPTLRIGVAHGQLKTSELEKVMEKFLAKKIDVLLATKIIESGLDIPNANTIFINRAHHFGLAELYQLRGRVGRSNIQAYCYLIVPPIKTIGGNTLKRLLAIEEFTELGSGFNLAMRDMEIRGAGDLLGPQQSGFINEIGFDLYQKILDEAVKEVKLEEFPDLFKELKEEKPNYLD
ncbi:MAG TPA: transcription-repair coupling factor, partial [Candidatus Kapabacteria bacterium]|nr:transcription-repair coupling factor [Candidatus Kapabacteria bacterium]